MLNFHFYKSSFILAFLLLFVGYGFSQTNLSFYSSSHPKIGFGYQFSSRFWSEARIYNFYDISDLTPELVFCYNVVQKDRHNIYIGLGGTVNVYNGLEIPIGTQFYPLKDFKNFSLQIEFLPITTFRDYFHLQSAFGIRYQFGKSSK